MGDPSTRVPCPGGIGKKRPCWCAPGLSGCRNHAPELADQRRLNGSKRTSGPDIPLRSPRARAAAGMAPLPPGEGREWAPFPSSRRAERTETKRAAQQEAFEAAFDVKFAEEVPDDQTARREVRRALRAVMLTSPQADARVRAAMALNTILASGPGVTDAPPATESAPKLDELFDS